MASKKARRSVVTYEDGASDTEAYENVDILTIQEQEAQRVLRAQQELLKTAVPNVYGMYGQNETPGLSRSSTMDSTDSGSSFMMERRCSMEDDELEEAIANQRKAILDQQAAAATQTHKIAAIAQEHTAALAREAAAEKLHNKRDPDLTAVVNFAQTREKDFIGLYSKLSPTSQALKELNDKAKEYVIVRTKLLRCYKEHLFWYLNLKYAKVDMRGNPLLMEMLKLAELLCRFKFLDDVFEELAAELRDCVTEAAAEMLARDAVNQAICQVQAACETAKMEADVLTHRIAQEALQEAALEEQLKSQSSLSRRGSLDSNSSMEDEGESEKTEELVSAGSESSDESIDGSKNYVLNDESERQSAASEAEGYASEEQSDYTKDDHYGDDRHDDDHYDDDHYGDDHYGDDHYGDDHYGDDHYDDQYNEHRSEKDHTKEEDTTTTTEPSESSYESPYEEGLETLEAEAKSLRRRVTDRLQEERMARLAAVDPSVLTDKATRERRLARLQQRKLIKSTEKAESGREAATVLPEQVIRKEVYDRLKSGKSSSSSDLKLSDPVTGTPQVHKPAQSLHQLRTAQEQSRATGDNKRVLRSGTANVTAQTPIRKAKRAKWQDDASHYDSDYGDQVQPSKPALTEVLEDYSNAKKANMADARRAARAACMPSPEPTLLSKRTTPQHILKNKGISRPRKPESGNARLHNKYKYEKKLRQMSGLKPKMREASDEPDGIKVHPQIARSHVFA